MYRVPLKVVDTKGKRITAFIHQIDATKNRMCIAPIEAVRKHNPPFAVNGEIKFAYNRCEHRKHVEKITAYLESLFLKELADEDNNSSNHSGDKSGGSEELSVSRPVKKSKRKNTGSVHDSGRGGKSTESDRGGKQSPKLVKSGNSQSESST